MYIYMEQVTYLILNSMYKTHHYIYKIHKLKNISILMALHLK